VRSGIVVRPLVGARVFAGDPATGAVYPSEPTDATGTFAIRDLPPATYEVAVELNAGLYIVAQRLPLVAGTDQGVGIAVTPSATPVTAQQGSGGGGGPSLWNNPLTAALLVFGGAVALGFIIEGATDDDDTATGEPDGTPTEN
jgi:hypothetical protein